MAGGQLLEIPKGIQFGGTLRILDHNIQIEARISSTSFFVDAFMDRLDLMGVIQLGATLDANKRAVGRPRFLMDFAIFPTLKALVHIECAFSLPLLRSHGSAMVILNDDGYAFNSTLSLFGGLLTARAHGAWDWGFNSFVLKIATSRPFNLGFSISGTVDKSTPAVATWNGTSRAMVVDAHIHALGWNTAVQFGVVGEGDTKEWLGMTIGEGGWYGSVAVEAFLGLCSGTAQITFAPVKEGTVTHSGFAIALSGRVDFSNFVTNIANGFEMIKNAVETQADRQMAKAESPWVVKVKRFVDTAGNAVDALCTEMFGESASFCGLFAGWIGNIAAQASKIIGWVTNDLSFGKLVSDVTGYVRDATAAVAGFIAQKLKAVAGMLQITAGTELSLTRRKVVNCSPAQLSLMPSSWPMARKQEVCHNQPLDSWEIQYKFDANLLGLKKTFEGAYSLPRSYDHSFGFLNTDSSVAATLWNNIRQGFGFKSAVSDFLNGAGNLAGKIDKAWGDSKEKVERAFEKMVSDATTWASDVFDGAMDGLLSLATTFGEVATDVARKALNAGKMALEAAGGLLGKGCAGLKDLFTFRSNSCDSSNSKVSSLKEAWVKAVKAHEDAVAKHLVERRTEVSGTFHQMDAQRRKDLLETELLAAADKAEEVWEDKQQNAFSCTSRKGSNMERLAEALKVDLTEICGDACEEIGQWIDERIAKIKLTVSNALNKIKDTFGKWLDGAGEWLKGLKFVDGVKDLAEDAKDGIVDAGKAVVTAFKCDRAARRWWQKLKLWC